VKTLSLHDEKKKSYFVQEEGKPKGLLCHGKPPEIVPELNETIQVYINSDDPRSPQYRWDKIESKPQQQQRGGRGPQPRGRR
jgi:hypothetical protein